MKLKEHPTVIRHHQKMAAGEVVKVPAKLDAAWLKQIAIDAGADDVGIVEIERSVLDDQRVDILQHFPSTRTLLSFVCRMNREPIRSTARSVANLEFHHRGDQVNEVAQQVVADLERHGVRAINPSMGFPMEMDQFPGKLWVVSHKPVAEAAGLGVMGIHRNVIHPTFGNFILLGTVLIDSPATAYDQPIDYNPCLECKLCVSACPVGAISPKGEFNFSACYTHNYREFMGGFTDWTEEVADSRDRFDYRNRVGQNESASMWQSLSFGASYKAAYCLSVCPAGEDVIGPYLADKKSHLAEYVKPLQEKKETIYVLANSDAEEYVAKRFPSKQAKRVGDSLRPSSIQGFLDGVGLVFQPGKSAGLDATYHFTFTGSESKKATIVIRDKAISVAGGHVGTASLRVTADAKTWLGFLAKERSIAWALLRRKIRLKGSPRLLLAFGNCFPK
ncbi:4Fe-4S binding protein [Planctomycetota bacterium]